MYFDEYVKLKDVQNQLIVSPPLKYQPIVTPQGNANKYVEVIFKDTLLENTTYTLNFGQSIEDNNEGNPNSYLSYVFSTGSYLDSLSLTGIVTDAYKEKAETFISVMLYKIDSTYTDSTVYLKPPNYITNTLDSVTIFTLKNLKAGKYALVAIKDEAKNNIFDQNSDKIGFVTDTINLPTDSVYGLSLFREVPNYTASVPSMAGSNRILFGYTGAKKEEIEINSLTTIPDSVQTKFTKVPEKDSINFWFTPYKPDSIVFTISNTIVQKIDTFTVKTKKMTTDSLSLKPNQSSSLDLILPYYINANTPIKRLNKDSISLINLEDSTQLAFKTILDTLKNRIEIQIDKEPNKKYGLTMLPGAVTDFFNTKNDTLAYRLATGSLADFGNLTINLAGKISFPIMVQLTDEKGTTIREIYSEETTIFEFNILKPSKYRVRLIFDDNHNKKWDTGNYLKKLDPERVLYYPKTIDLRANWEQTETFTLY